MKGRLNPALFFVKESQIIVHEADHPNLISDLSDAHRLAGERGAEIDFAFVETDSATTSDADGAIVKRVIGLRRGS